MLDVLGADVLDGPRCALLFKSPVKGAFREALHTCTQIMQKYAVRQLLQKVLNTVGSGAISFKYGSDGGRSGGQRSKWYGEVLEKW